MLVMLCMYDGIRWCRKHICTHVTEAEVARARNVFKTNLFMQLDGM